MSDLGSDMSELDRICPAWGPNMSGHQKHYTAEK
jgi:hypothetical protein